MKMIARCRIVVDVPFNYDIPEPLYQPVRPELEGGRKPGEEMSNENQRLTARANAAKYAKEQIIENIIKGLEGDVLANLCLVEEVREAE
jgi:hypothetical protein